MPLSGRTSLLAHSAYAASASLRRLRHTACRATPAWLVISLVVAPARISRAPARRGAGAAGRRGPRARGRQDRGGGRGARWLDPASLGSDQAVAAGRVLGQRCQGACGAFLDTLQKERLAALFQLAGCYGLRRSELCNLRWTDVDLATRQIHIRDDAKTQDSDRVITIGPFMTEVLLTWRGQQMMERLDWADGWTDTGHVITKADGTPVKPGWVTERFRT